MATTARGQMADLIQGLKEHGLPQLSALEAKLTLIFEQLVEEKQRDIEQADALQRRVRELEGSVPRPAAYEKLEAVLVHALDQAAHGKGKDRHVSVEDQPFEEQPICTLQRIYGTGYAFGQASKKMEEAIRLPKERAVAELLGAINYIAAAVIVLEETSG